MIRSISIPLCACIALLLNCGSGAAIDGRKPARVTLSIPASGITTVILRAANAEQAKAVVAKTGAPISVSGVPEGGAKGYHSSDPNWKETPPEEWGLGFKTKIFGDTLVISTWNEMAYIHHHYELRDIEVSTSPGLKIVRQTRTLTGDGAPDLTKPALK